MVGKDKIRYDGGSRKCLPAREGIGVEELRGMVREIVGDGLQVERLWYNLKYDENIKMAAEGDKDVRMMLKESDEHGYYIWAVRTVWCGVQARMGAPL